MSLIDSKTIDMFYFTGDKHTTPNCPVELQPDLNPSSGAQSYVESNKDCSYGAAYHIPFFLNNAGPKYSEWSVNAHEARPGHHTQVNKINYSHLWFISSDQVTKTKALCFYCGLNYAYPKTSNSFWLANGKLKRKPMSLAELSTDSFLRKHYKLRYRF